MHPARMIPQMILPLKTPLALAAAALEGTIVAQFGGRREVDGFHVAPEVEVAFGDVGAAGVEADV